MKILNLAVFLGLLALIGCDDNGIDNDIPETMPGQYDPDINNDIDNPNGDLDPDGSLGVDDDPNIDVDVDLPDEPAPNPNAPPTGVDPATPAGQPAGDTDVVEEVPPGSEPLENDDQP